MYIHTTAWVLPIIIETGVTVIKPIKSEGRLEDASCSSPIDRTYVVLYKRHLDTRSTMLSILRGIRKVSLPFILKGTLKAESAFPWDSGTRTCSVRERVRAGKCYLDLKSTVSWVMWWRTHKTVRHPSAFQELAVCRLDLRHHSTARTAVASTWMQHLNLMELSAESSFSACDRCAGARSQSDRSWCWGHRTRLCPWEYEAPLWQEQNKKNAWTDL